MGLSFLDPPQSKDGRPYGPQRYREIVRECWYISDQTNTSYADILDLSFTERSFLIQFIAEKQEATKKAIEEARQRNQSSKS